MAVTVAAVGDDSVAAGVQAYVSAPVAVNVADDDPQISPEEVTFTEGLGVIKTVTDPFTAGVPQISVTFTE